MIIVVARIRYERAAQLSSNGRAGFKMGPHIPVRRLPKQIWAAQPIAMSGWYPCRDSNPGLRFRKPPLYPPELQGHAGTYPVAVRKEGHKSAEKWWR